MMTEQFVSFMVMAVALGFIYGMVFSQWFTKYLINKGHTPKYLLKLGFIKDLPKEQKK